MSLADDHPEQLACSRFDDHRPQRWVASERRCMKKPWPLCALRLGRRADPVHAHCKVLGVLLTTWPRAEHARHSSALHVSLADLQRQVAQPLAMPAQHELLPIARVEMALKWPCFKARLSYKDSRCFSAWLCFPCGQNSHFESL